MAREGVVEVPDEIVSVTLVKTHECSTHDDEFNFVGVVAKTLQLLNAILCLQVRIIACSNGSHRRRLVTCVRLS